MKENIKTCSCCEKKFNLVGSVNEYSWKLDGDIFCSYSCYSKVFDSKYQASSISANLNVSGYTRGRIVDKGYERHGSR